MTIDIGSVKQYKSPPLKVRGGWGSYENVAKAKGWSNFQRS